MRLDGKRRKPRPRHVKVDPAAQEQFKKTASAPCRQWQLPFRTPQVELWTVDEHRVGLKPILHKVWCFDGLSGPRVV